MVEEGRLVDITFDWVTRVLYLAVNESGEFRIQSLPIDNPVLEAVYRMGTLSDDSVVSITVAPFTG